MSLACTCTLSAFSEPPSTVAVVASCSGAATAPDRSKLPAAEICDCCEALRLESALALLPALLAWLSLDSVPEPLESSTPMALPVSPEPSNSRPAAPPMPTLPPAAPVAVTSCACLLASAFTRMVPLAATWLSSMAAATVSWNTPMLAPAPTPAAPPRASAPA